MGLVIGIISGWLAILTGVIVRFIQDDKDGLRDGFDDSEEVLDVRS